MRSGPNGEPPKIPRGVKIGGVLQWSVDSLDSYKLKQFSEAQLKERHHVQRLCSTKR
jgi:hypothetical protein